MAACRACQLEEYCLMILNSTIKNKPTTPATTYSTEGAIEYITGEPPNSESITDEKEIRRKLSEHEQIQYGWTKHFNELSMGGYVTYHLTITYNELKNRSLAKNEINEAEQENKNYSARILF